MFGKNVLRKQDLSDPLNLYIQEIFYTIQGEGPFAGTPAVFVRLAGCCLKCFYCDTEFESGMKQTRSLDLILDQVSAVNKAAKLVVLTGGEPLRQDIVALCIALHTMGFTTQIETAGPLWVPGLEDLVQAGITTIVCSPKTGKVRPEILKWCKHWKYIIKASDEVSAGDGLPMSSTQIPFAIQELQRPPEGTTVWLQPCDEYDPELNKLNVEMATGICMLYGYRLCLQIHKIVNLP